MWILGTVVQLGASDSNSHSQRRIAMFCLWHCPVDSEFPASEPESLQACCTKGMDLFSEGHAQGYPRTQLRGGALILS